MKRFASLVLFLAGLACLAALGYVLMRGDPFAAGAPGPSGGFPFLGPPAIGAALCFGALLLRAEWRVMLALCLIAALVSVYGAELYLTYGADDPGEAASAARGLDHDPRSKLDLVRDLRAGGVAAYPFVHPALLLAPSANGQAHSVIRIDGAEVLPVGGIGGVVTVVCREAGAYLTYTADRHGFHNPPDAWPPASGRADIVVIGDSFAQGQCVPDGQGMVARLHGTERSTVSLGAGHDGPLLMLAALREFARPLRPETAIWLYYEGNDLLIDLPRESRSPLLIRYLEPDFDQNLANRQEAVDAALATYADSQLIEAAAEERDAWRGRVLGIATLRALRRVLGATASHPPPDLALFERILSRARDDVRGWGGQMVFVYLPSSNTLFHPSAFLDAMRADVLAIADGLDLPVIDLVPAFGRIPDPNVLFYYPGSHYSPEGHALAAREIGAALEAGGYLPKYPVR